MPSLFRRERVCAGECAHTGQHPVVRRSNSTAACNTFVIALNQPLDLGSRSGCASAGVFPHHEPGRGLPGLEHPDIGKGLLCVLRALWYCL